MTKSPYIQVLYDYAVARASSLGFALPEAPMTGGGSDGNFTAAIGTPKLGGLGCDGAHMLHEHCHVLSLVPRCAFCAIART